MIPIQELLNRIRWDPEFAKGNFEPGYYDRAENRIILVPLKELTFPENSPQTFQLTDHEGQVHRIPTGAYGFGFQIGRPDEPRTYGHGGGAPGMNAILRVYPESGQSVIVMCNLDSPSASRMGDWLHARMPLK